MKQIAMILLLSVAFGVGANAQSQKSSKAASKATPEAAAGSRPSALALPPGAERVSEGLWRARDAEGRTWMYKKTPFGMVRYEENAPKNASAAAQPGMRVLEAGPERIVFERRTPFGSRTWTKAPAELADEERRALDEWRKAAKK